MIVVVDASVALKWFLKQHQDEPDTVPATKILLGIHGDRVRMVEPPHFLAEVMSVLARRYPESALQDLEDLVQIKWEIAESVPIYSLAMKLSTLLQHHMFDTLYHATSLLTKGATLVTADDRYYAKAKGHGSIVRLSDFALPGMTGEAPLH